ncbi:MAG: Redox-sensing transcriptional repressor Rex [Phycisphaerae bacterium]|nr:Redox-sensing transcriptional repressor Rex [Phycisphaerae bacterium]
MTAAQVRRDLMTIGYAGSPAHGYDIAGLIGTIDDLLNPSTDEGCILIGAGHLGRAILAYAASGGLGLPILAAFDNDSGKVRHLIHGCYCYPIEQLPEVVSRLKVLTALLAVPAPVAQAVVEQLVATGIRSLVNFAPVRIRAPQGIFVQDVDIAVALWKAAFHAQQANSAVTTAKHA